jgi:hypothetical protein
MKQDIEPLDENGRYHGYCERYHNNGQLWWKGVYLKHMCFGYHEEYNVDGSVREIGTGYWLGGYDDRVSADNAEGYCYVSVRRNCESP